ncbi:metalloregulator ArsR/SmtB family transcription factor [candidate division GN15 bacterium]|nr:metalloregulator ArsR/SmtB family transcription factor [candidate division GN15 bacterium]
MNTAVKTKRVSRRAAGDIDTTTAAAWFKALGDDSRLRIVLALREQELCVCQIVALLELANSTVSQHLTVLRNAGLIESHKRGRWVYYRLSDAAGGLQVGRSLSRLLDAVAAGADWQDDGRRLKRILKLDPEQLCQITYLS